MMTAKKNLPEKFFEQAALKQEATAFFYCRPQDDRWVTMSWNRYRDEVATLASWLLSQGVGRGAKVALMSSNRPEWIISDLAILSIGAITVPVYTSASAHEINYILNHSECEWIIVDTIDRVSPLDRKGLRGLVSFNKFAESTAQELGIPAYAYAATVHDTVTPIKAPVQMNQDEIATLVYTSGTTGLPKGVIHTHGTIAEAIYSSQQLIESPEGTIDRFFSFLPLCHVAERCLVETGSIGMGAEVAFARNIDTIAQDLPICQPTMLLCVPRLWEKMQEGILAKLHSASPVKQIVFRIASFMGGSRVQGNHIDASANGGIFPALSDVLVGKKLREALGLNRVRMFITGSAPTRPEVQKFFISFGMPIREVYALTENFACGVVSLEDDILTNSCGKPFPGAEVKIAEDGEILFRAPWNFKGYYKNEQATAEVLSSDNWFATGDLGSLDAAGRLFIVGRKKELLKTSNGKYVAPVPIEDSIKANPLVKEVMMVGDSRKYCVALIALENPVVDDKARESLVAWFDKVNKPLASYEAVKRVGILKEGFTIENGSLTPTMKVKRNAVVKAKEHFIDEVYASKDFVVVER
ncbi:MAG: long-chain fatty acid--CoA ligase [Chitinophagaceae bacterium]|nr:long-chain fatty acid--CoA ligase [Oligoflexus sp.]